MALVIRFFLVIGLLNCLSSAEAANKIIPLSEARKQLELPAYSLADRQTLADQADFMIRNLFVHRELKIQDFGSKTDPLPRLTELRKQSKGYSNDEFHSTLSSIFADLHDLHTNYFAPAPRGCGAAFVPVRFESVLDGEKQIVVVSRLLNVKPEASQGIELSDELLEVDGVAAAEVVAELGKVSGGANADAMKVRAVQMLSFRSLLSQAVPIADTIKFKLQGAAGVYEKEIPWFAFLSESCLNNADAPHANKKPERGSVLRPERNPMTEMQNSVDEFQKRFNRVFGNPALVKKDPNWAVESPLDEIFEVAALKTPAGIIGYVQLKGFSWDNKNLDVGTVIEGFRRSIESSLSDAIGLVIDVRGNPGGYITFSEKLVQLFSKHSVEPTTVRMYANSLNESIFLKANGQDNRWSEAIRKAEKAGSTYTERLSITPRREANSFGQVWYRPVVVLTDAACYSACDLFAAGMQDNGAGVIVGLHKNTGAGGANVMEYRTFRTIMGTTNNPFETLPFGQNMRVSWRQAIRAGIHDGELIEDKGIESDFVVPLKRVDIGLESKDLMKRVHSIVDELRPKYVSGLAVRRGSSVPLVNGAVASWKENVYGADSVDLYVEGKKMAKVDVVHSDEPKEVSFALPKLKGQWFDQSVVLEGRLDGKQVFRSVRELMWRGDYDTISEGTLAEAVAMDFSEGKTGLFHPVTLRGTEAQGWQSVDNHLRMGKGPNYANNVLSRAFLSLKLDGKGGKIVFDIRLDAESENDSLRIYAINPDTAERLHYFAGSRLSQKKGVGLPLPADWDKADLVFEFESDENWSMAGPDISNVKLVRVQ